MLNYPSSLKKITQTFCILLKKPLLCRLDLSSENEHLKNREPIPTKVPRIKEAEPSKKTLSKFTHKHPLGSPSPGLAHCACAPLAPTVGSGLPAAPSPCLAPTACSGFPAAPSPPDSASPSIKTPPQILNQIKPITYGTFRHPSLEHKRKNGTFNQKAL